MAFKAHTIIVTGCIDNLQLAHRTPVYTFSILFLQINSNFGANDFVLHTVQATIPGHKEVS